MKNCGDTEFVETAFTVEQIVDSGSDAPNDKAMHEDLGDCAFLYGTLGQSAGCKPNDSV